MAIGASYIFGVRTPENFNAPFVSKDIKEFWNRWHMTLSFWFRDFLFSRITMALVRTRKIKNKLVIASIAFMINMFVMGVWHGLELTTSFTVCITECYYLHARYSKRNRNSIRRIKKISGLWEYLGLLRFTSLCSDSSSSPED